MKGLENMQSKISGTSDSFIAIKLFQDRFHLQLPDDYCSFIEARSRGVVFNAETMLMVETLGAEIALDSLFGFSPDKKWMDLNYENGEFIEDLPQGGAVIGRDLLGGHLVLLTEKEQGVYYWDDIRSFPQSCDGSNVYRISESFTAFIEKIGPKLL